MHHSFFGNWWLLIQAPLMPSRKKNAENGEALTKKIDAAMGFYSASVYLNIDVQHNHLKLRPLVNGFLP
jgi:hypothetical protein